MVLRIRAAFQRGSRRKRGQSHHFVIPWLGFTAATVFGLSNEKKKKNSFSSLLVPRQASEVKKCDLGSGY